MLYRISTTLVYIFLKLFFNLEIKGKESFPKNSHFILASNHLSNLDPPVLAASCPCKVSFLAKEELFNNRIASFYLKDVGAIPLKRDGSDIVAVRIALRIVKDKSLIIFPQGTRGVSIDSVNSGVGFICKKAKVPVIAARIYGTGKVLPKNAKFFRKGKIKVIFSRVKNIGDDDTSESITRKVMETIKNL